jgi:hypothetical protein
MATLPQMRHDFGYPKSWNWERDGYTAEGSFVRLAIGPTPFGVHPILVLLIGGSERAVWVTSPDLRARLAGELERRRAFDFVPEERITIVRGSVERGLACGRPTWPFRVAFPDAPCSANAHPAGVHAPNAAEGWDEDGNDDRVKGSSASS